MRRLIVGASIAAFALSCSSVKPTDFKPSMQEGIMADAKSTVPGKVQVTYPNGIVLLKRKDGTIRIFDGDGDIVAEGKIIETQRDGTVIFISKYGSKMQLDPDGSMTLKPKETPSNLIPAPNIR